MTDKKNKPSLYYSSNDDSLDQSLALNHDTPATETIPSLGSVKKDLTGQQSGPKTLLKHKAFGQIPHDETPLMNSLDAQSTPNTLDLDDAYFADTMFLDSQIDDGVIGHTTPPSKVEINLTPQLESVHNGIQLPDRYQDEGLLGAGGMGEVRRVKDLSLNRSVALKLMHARFVNEERSRIRFMHEAQVVSQLQHQNILPVYDYGSFLDNTLYFTMKEIKGQSLSHYIQYVHAMSDEQGWRQCQDGWSLHRLISVLYDVSMAMIYAHEHGVLHRDLKADNVMVGDLGEVLVVDWGLAKLMEVSADTQQENMIRLSHAFEEGEGGLCGTPRYLAPELASMTGQAASPSTEVYALGVMLYEILVGTLPYYKLKLSQLLKMISEKGLPSLPTKVDSEQHAHSAQSFYYVSNKGTPLPLDLVSICQRAIAFNAEQRYPSVRSFSEALGAWLDGSQKRQQALVLVQKADALEQDIKRAQHEAKQLRKQAEAQAQYVQAWQMNEAKKALWALEDKAFVLEQHAQSLTAKQVQLYRAALAQKSDLFEAHRALAFYYQQQHRQAEQQGDLSQIQSLELSLKEHLNALPFSSIEKQKLKKYLSGQANCVLRVEPTTARAKLARFELKDRRLVLGDAQELGTLPIEDYSLDIGSYVLQLEAEGYHPCRYPIYNQRNDHHDGLTPEGEPFAIKLLPLGTLEEDDCYVPGGWCRLGGDPHTPNSLPAQKVWIDAFVMKRFSVTNTQYIQFLNDLLQQGRTDEALQHVPREQSSSEDELGAMVYILENQRFSLPQLVDFAECPVTRITWYSARAYADWLAKQSGKPWRLPMEFEWEKAARGVDGRSYPWGEHHDPSWSCMKDSHEGEVKMYPVDRFPMDESIYGVRGTAGNTRDWCLDRFRDDGPLLKNGRLLMPSEEDLADTGFKSTRGGSYGNSSSRARSADRDWWFPHRCYIGRGLRLVWSV